MTPEQEIKTLRRANEKLEERCAWLENELGHVVKVGEVEQLRLHFRMTPKEAQLLLLLYQQKPDVALTRDRAFMAMYENHDNVEIKILDVFMSKMRSKFGEQNKVCKRLGGSKGLLATGYFGAFTLVETIWGTGYRLTPAGRAKVKAALDPEPEQGLTS